MQLNGLFFLIFLIFIMSLKFNEAKLNDRCPDDYFLHMDELCYPKVRKPCPFETKPVQTASITAPTSIKVGSQAAINLKKLDCPEGSLRFQNKCRKIICSLGEYYRGICLQPICPQGLVWRGKKCQEPEYLTTIIEIDNVIVSDVMESPVALAMSHINEVVYHISTTTHKPHTTLKPQYPKSSATSNSDATNYTETCCKVFTPRICKLYRDKWLCFNRKYTSCDRRVSKAKIIYLKAPEIKYDHSLLVMPPYPSLDVGETNICENNSDAVDYSGCAGLRSESCSPHCYRYICPSSTCAFVDFFEYCKNYSRIDGCLLTDGCLWDWCQI